MNRQEKCDKINWYNASRWELYTSMDGAEDAAKRLNAAICSAIMEEKSEKETRDIAYAAFKAEINFGAYDTEPLYHLEFILRRLFPSIEW